MLIPPSSSLSQLPYFTTYILAIATMPPWSVCIAYAFVSGQDQHFLGSPTEGWVGVLRETLSLHPFGGLFLFASA